MIVLAISLRNQVFLHVACAALVHLLAVAVIRVVTTAVTGYQTNNNACIFYRLPLFP